MTRKIQQIFFVCFFLLTNKLRAKLHSCSTEIYVENVTLNDCLNEPIEIEMARCRGQCYSEDFLIYDWQSEPVPYRHKHHIHCCTPKQTYSRELSLICQNKQTRQIVYPFITRCECKLCTDRCEIFK